MTKEEKDKLLVLMGKECNFYSGHLNEEIARLHGKIEGADYMLNRLLEHLRIESEAESEG